MVKIEVDTDKLLTVDQAAKQIGMHRATLYRWIEKDKVTTINLGGSIFIPLSEVDRLKKLKEKEG